MELLSSEQVKTEADRKETERIERVKKLNDAETEIAQRVNAARENEKVELTQIEESIGKKREGANAELRELEGKISSRRSELSGLLKPIDEIKNQAEQILASAKEKEADNDKDRAALAELGESLSERAEDLKDREAEDKERADGLDRREAGIKKEEDALKLSSTSLAGKWVEYHKQVSDLNAREKAIERKDKEVEGARIAIDEWSKANAAEGERLRLERKAIKDGYVALEQAKKHLGIEN